MTRFELANFLGSRLRMLPSEERHRIIDRHIATVNDAIMAGMNEAEAVEQLGDPEILVNVILARHHIDPEATAPQEEKATEEISDAHSEETQKTEESHTSFRDRFLNKKSSEKAEDALSAAESTEKDDSTVKRAAIKSKNVFSRLFTFTADITLGLTNLMVFCVLWIPSMLLTLTGIVCTVAVITLYVFSGIGFMGVCIAGAGCCIVGVSFTVWLGNILTGGKRKCEKC